mgnify:CR=1 FL=1
MVRLTIACKVLLRKALLRSIILEIIKIKFITNPNRNRKKAKLTLDFLRMKTEEYDALRKEIKVLEREVKNIDDELS